MNPILFHCSSLPALMTNGRSKTEPLGETSKAVVRDQWIKHVFGREKADTVNKYTQKGIMVESDSLTLVHEVLGEKLFKNQKQYQNDLVIGTPDVVTDHITDIKSCFDLWTFASVDEDKAKKDYFHQLVGYSWLLNMPGKVRLIYTLVNTPEDIINDELQRLSYKVRNAEDYRKNYIFDDIPATKRLKAYEFTVTEDDINTVKERCVDAQKYAQTLSL